MPRQKSPNRDKAFNLYKDSNGIMKPRDIAKNLNENPNNVRVWKSSDKWDEKLGIKIEKKESPKRGAPKGNKNAVGKKGGAPKYNGNRLSSYKYNKYFRETGIEVLRELRTNGASMTELINEAARVAFAQYIEAQSHLDYEMSLKKKGEDYIEYITTHEKVIDIMNTQSKSLKAITDIAKIADTIERDNTLKDININLIKEQLSNKALDREEQKARIELLKSKIINKDSSKEEKLDEYFAMLESAIKK